MSYANITNPANFQLQDFAQFGFRVITTDFIPVPGEQYRTLYVLQDAVVTATTQKGDDITSKAILAGTLLHGLFNSVSITSGRVLAYAAGRITADEIIALYESYVSALGGTLENTQCAIDAINEEGVDLFADASLVMIPEGYGTGVVYGQRPLTSDSQLTFTRASTATRVGPDGAIAVVGSNVPRIDYTGGGCGKLLLEPQRTNLNIYSEDITNATWDKLDLETTNYANVVVSPDGYTNADKVIPNTTSAQYHGIQLSSGRPTLTSGVVYTFSVFAKAQGYDKIRVQNFSQDVRAQFNLTTGTLINQSGTTSTFITPYGNGWYRIGFTYTQSSTVAAYWNTLVISTDDNSSAPIAWVGNGTDSIAVYGHTIEEGPYATSYIPTLGAAVTRGADAASKTGISSLIGQTEGTIYLEADIQKRNEADFYVALSAGSVLGDAIYLYQPSSGNLQLLIRKTGNADGTISILSANWTAGLNKVAIAYTATTAEVFINGVTKGTTSFVSAPACSQFTIGSRPDVLGTLVGAGPYNQALLFKTRLTNQELQDLTTL